MNRHERRAAEARARRDDPQAAREASENDRATVFQQMRDLDVEVVDIGGDTSRYGDGDGCFILVTIGHRGALTAREAKACAELWRTATARHPKAIFNPSLFGYDSDPRELYEFEDVRLYLRQWAQFAGIAGPQDIKVEVVYSLVALLAACGCAGFEHVIPVMPDGGPIRPTSEQ
jgi:hypothetical protein